MPNTASKTMAPAAKPTPTKYKATCDYCSISKVKCDRGQPQCLRCIRSDVECHYSESRRTGKAKRKLANQSDARQQASSNSCSSPEYASSQSITNASDELSDQCFGDNIFHQKVINGFGQNHYTPNSMCSPHVYPTHSHDSSGSDVAPYSQAYSESQTNFQNFNLERLEARALSHMDTASMQSSGFTLGVDLGDNNHSLLESSIGFNTAPESCKRKVLAALERMYTPVQCCSTTSGDKRRIAILPTVDACLNNNRSAKHTVLQILRCPCVDSDWSLLLLLTLVVHRIVDSYFAILKKIQSTPTSEDDEVSVDEYFDMRNMQSGAPFTLDVPMAVGGYVLDGMAKNKVVACLIRAEIEELGNVIEMLAQKHDGQNLQFGQAPFKELIQSLAFIRQKALEMGD